MRLIIQRVSWASVNIDGAIKAEIKNGLLLLLGIEDADTTEDIDWLVKKTVNMRIFGDNQGLMNLSLHDINGEVLVISQFTLHASTKKGNRPSFIKAAKPTMAIPLYQQFINTLQAQLNTNVQTGIFGADMKVALLNNGPVTIVLDSKNKE